MAGFHKDEHRLSKTPLKPGFFRGIEVALPPTPAVQAPFLGLVVSRSPPIRRSGGRDTLAPSEEGDAMRIYFRAEDVARVWKHAGKHELDGPALKLRFDETGEVQLRAAGGGPTPRPIRSSATPRASCRHRRSTRATRRPCYRAPTASGRSPQGARRRNLIRRSADGTNASLSRGRGSDGP
jgi:hypothetical protein